MFRLTGNFTTVIKFLPQNCAIALTEHAHKRAAPASSAQPMSRTTHTLDVFDIIASVPAAVRWKLDQEIDFEHRDIRDQVIPQDLGRMIADVLQWWTSKTLWRNLLGLSVADRNKITLRNSNKPKLQRYSFVISLL